MTDFSTLYGRSDHHAWNTRTRNVGVYFSTLSVEVIINSSGSVLMADYHDFIPLRVEVIINPGPPRLIPGS